MSNYGKKWNIYVYYGIVFKLVYIYIFNGEENT